VPPTTHVFVTGEIIRIIYAGTNTFSGVTSFSTTTRTITANTTALATDETIFVNTTAGTVGYQLPAASSNSGRSIHVKKISTDANTMNITSAGGNIEGSASFATTSTTRPSYHAKSDGTSWWFI